MRDEPRHSAFDVACSAVVRALSETASVHGGVSETSSRLHLRVSADTEASRLRYHDDLLHMRLRPQDPERAVLFDALEQARFEALGAQRWRGVARNRRSWLAERPRDGFTRAVVGDAQALAETLHAALSAYLIGEAPLPAAAHSVRHRLRGDAAFWRAACTQLRHSLADQGEYGLVARALVLRLDIEDLTAPQAQRTQERTPSQAGGQHDSAEDAPGRRPVETWRRGRRRAPPEARRQEPSYTAYTRQFDEVVQARDLLSGDERRRLRRQLDTAVRARPGLRRWAHRLERALAADVPRPWVTERAEHGRIDYTRLAQWVAAPLTEMDRLRPGRTAAADTVVTLLVDNSASMHGRPIELAATCTDLVATVLDRARINVEILGFTTVFGRDNPCLRQWRGRDGPADPGRLNALRHIVYKPAGAPWRSRRRDLGVMLSPALLKENIDGEALDWAYRRLRRRPEARRVLLVLADGAPDDGATLTANPPDYLVRHLRHVVARIESERQVQLVAIGIGYDISRFYPRAITVHDSNRLGEALIAELIDLLTVRH